MLTGLAVANVIGVPVVTFIGQMFGWRWMFAIVLVLAVLTMLAVRVFASRQVPAAGASMRGELAGLRTRHLWVGGWRWPSSASPGCPPYIRTSPR